jgi:PilZ domain-containing protein
MDATAERRYPRISRLCLITFVNREAGEQRTPVSVGRTLDISPVGVGLEVFEEVRAGSTMEMEIALEGALLEVKGKVVHVTSREEGRAVIGVAFDAPQELLAGVRVD